MKLALFPLHTVLFPGMALPLHIFEPRYREMINSCLAHNAPFGVVLIRAGAEVGGGAEPHPVGTWAHVSRVERLPDGRIDIEAIGQERFKIATLHADRSYLTGTVETFPLEGADGAPARRAAKALMPWLRRYLNLLGEAAETQRDDPRLPRDPAALAYLAAIVAQIPPAEKQDLLGVSAAAALLDRECAIYRREISLVRSMLSSGQSRNDVSFSPN